MCNLFYDKIDGKKPDPLKDEVKKIIIYNNLAEHHQLDRRVFIHKYDEIGIKTVLRYPKAYEIFKNGNNNEYLVGLALTIRSY